MPKLYHHNGAVNIVIPNWRDGKPLTIMTPMGKSLLSNVLKASEMLEEHIASSKQ